MTDLLLKNVRPMGAEATDILIRDGRIENIGAVNDANMPAEDGGGAIVLPGLVEAGLEHQGEQVPPPAGLRPRPD